MKVEDITALYEQLKKKYLGILDNFKKFNLSEEEEDETQANLQKAKYRMSSTIMEKSSEELLESK